MARVCIVQSNWKFSSIVLLSITRPCGIRMCRSEPSRIRICQNETVRSMGFCYGSKSLHPTKHRIFSHLRVFVLHFGESENSTQILSYTHGWCPWLYSYERVAIVCLQVSQWRIRWTSSSTALGRFKRRQWLVCVCNLLVGYFIFYSILFI